MSDTLPGTPADPPPAAAPDPPRDAAGRFLRGPGRRAGSRNRFGRALAMAVMEDFAAHRGQILMRLRQSYPQTYAAMVSRLLPPGALADAADEDDDAGLWLAAFASARPPAPPPTAPEASGPQASGPGPEPAAAPGFPSPASRAEVSHALDRIERELLGHVLAFERERSA